MNFWFSEPVRVMTLILVCTLLWSLESIVPFYKYQNNRLRHSIPNIALALLLVLTNLVLSSGVAYVAVFTADNHIGLFNLIDILPVLKLVLGIAALDFFAYLAHILLHKSWLGWQFHRVHHSENAMDVTTAFRQHPGETLWRIFWQLAAILVFGVPLWIVVAAITISSLNAQLEHSNIKLNDNLDRFLRILFVTPNMHKVHHSREQKQTDSNYSNIFSFWDRFFGTYTSAVNFRELRYGLDDFDDKNKQTLVGLLKMPFVKYIRG